MGFYEILGKNCPQFIKFCGFELITLNQSHVLGEKSPPKISSGKIQAEERKQKLGRGTIKSAGEAATKTRKSASRQDRPRVVAQRVRSAEPNQVSTKADKVNEEVSIRLNKIKL